MWEGSRTDATPFSPEEVARAKRLSSNALPSTNPLLATSKLSKATAPASSALSASVEESARSSKVSSSVLQSALTSACVAAQFST